MKLLAADGLVDGLQRHSSFNRRQFGGSRAAQSKIKHIIIIMQENRSFDEYFGTYPGADGIPMSNGIPSVCVPGSPDKEMREALSQRGESECGRPACRERCQGRHQWRQNGRVHRYVPQTRRPCVQTRIFPAVSQGKYRM